MPVLEGNLMLSLHVRDDSVALLLRSFHFDSQMSNPVIDTTRLAGSRCRPRFQRRALFSSMEHFLVNLLIVVPAFVSLLRALPDED